MKKVVDDIVEYSNNSNQQFHIEVQTRNLVEEIVTQLVVERKRLGITQQEIADTTGIKAPNVTRIESCRYTPTLSILMRYAEAIGKELKFSLIDVKKLDREEQ